MKSKIINVLAFAVGAAVGSAVTWKILKTKYDRIVQEEIDSIRDVFSDAGNERDIAQEQSDDAADEEGRRECSGQINWDDLEDLEDEDDNEDTGAIAEYERLTRAYIDQEGGVETVAKEPYVIGPYDFGTLDDYHQVELTYYADGVLEDAEGNIVTDVDELIGEKSLYTFGEYEEDAVHVRNERLKTDFEILKDYATYAQARSIGPNRVDNE